MAAADDFPKLYYPDRNGNFIWEYPEWSEREVFKHSWEYPEWNEGEGSRHRKASVENPTTKRDRFIILEITKNGSTMTENIIKTDSKSFSSISAELNAINADRVVIVVNHNYDIPKGYHVKGLKLSDFKSTEELEGMTCAVILPNQEKLVGRLDIRGTMGLWLEDWKLANAEYEAVENKAQLWANFAILLGDLDKLKGSGTMFQSFHSKY